MAAVYILYMFQKMFMGPQGEIVEEVQTHGHALRDLNWREIAILVPLLLLIFWIGLYPKPFFALMGPAVDQLAASFSSLAMH
jgi:NADH-quinone oxidoreductase subunit M